MLKPVKLFFQSHSQWMWKKGKLKWTSAVLQNYLFCTLSNSKNCHQVHCTGRLKWSSHQHQSQDNGWRDCNTDTTSHPCISHLFSRVVVSHEKVYLSFFTLLFIPSCSCPHLMYILKCIEFLKYFFLINTTVFVSLIEKTKTFVSMFLCIATTESTVVQN